MPQTYHVIGPPGTGKTTYLSRQATRAVERYGTKSTLICSLTKAAAHEILGRGIPIADEMVGTLHAHCYRALGCPDLAETKLPEWNKENPQFALSYSVKGGVDDPNDATSKGNAGDYCLSRLNIRRAAMNGLGGENRDVRDFAPLWTQWKEGNGLMDFTDLIETCIEQEEKPPGEPDIMLGDEAQDWSRMEFKLFCDTWGRHAETVVLAGDFDQCLYSWRGADSRYFLDHPVPEENLKVLSQSYRVPIAVHDKAHAWIRTATDRMDVDYNPTEREGLVRRMDFANRNDPEGIIESVANDVSNGRTVMLLTSCSYMLSPIISGLKKAGIPFGNSFRKANAAWNPMTRKKGAKMSVDRVEAYLAPSIHKKKVWNKEEFITWTQVIQSKDKLRHGVKTILRDPEFKIPEEIGRLNELFATIDDTEAAIMMEIPWFRSALLKNHKNTVGYILDVVEKYGQESIVKKPPVTVGTIHSVKGGEADVVYLFPDLSLQAKESYEGSGEPRNSVIRTFYVGMTRAKEELVICGTSGNLNVEI